MSNALGVTNIRNEIHVELPARTWFRSFATRIRTLCGCTKQQNSEEIALPLQAVDSVRLVYMRRIEEASLHNVARQNPVAEEVPDDILPRIIRHRRVRQEQTTLEALEKALKEYESKHKTIISSTRVPQMSSFDKSSHVSRGSQTDTQEVVEELLKAVDLIKIKGSSNSSEEIKRVILYSSAEDLSRVDTDFKENSDRSELSVKQKLGTVDVASVAVGTTDN